MVKFAYLLVMSVLIVWIAGSGCVGNSASEVKESESKVSQDLAETQNNAPAEDLEIEPTQAEIRDLDSEVADLDDLLKNAGPEEEIVIEEL